MDAIATAVDAGLASGAFAASCNKYLPWICGACTFRNEYYPGACEVCDADNPATRHSMRRILVPSPAAASSMSLPPPPLLLLLLKW
jgi:hypothetical protein